MSESIWHGCVPLIAQPLVVQPLEEERLLDFDLFSGRIGPLEAGARLPAILQALASRLDRRRRALPGVASLLSWAPTGLAYNATLVALCWRAFELRGRPDVNASCHDMAERLAQTAGGAATQRPSHASRTPPWYPAGLVHAIGALQAERRAAVRALSERSSDRTRNGNAQPHSTSHRHSLTTTHTRSGVSQSGAST